MTPEIASALLLVLWLVLLVFFLFAVFVSAILACCLKERKRLYAVDGLLISATLLCAATLSVTLLPNVKKTISHTKPITAIKACDDAVASLDEVGYMEELPEPSHKIVLSLSTGSLGKELKDAEAIVQKQAADYPDFPEINSRLAIILHAEGKDTSQVFDHFSHVGGHPSALLRVLEDLYEMPSEDTSQKSDSTNSTEDTEKSKRLSSVIKAKLPKGWYQTTALLDVYRKYDPIELKAALATRLEDSQAWQFRIQIFLVIDAIFFLLGLVSLFCFFKFNKEDQAPAIPMTKEFRRMYACLISTLFAQVISGCAVGLWLGLSSVGSPNSAELSNVGPVVTACLVVFSTVVSLLMVYLLILKPQALSFQAACTQSSIELKPAKFAIFALGGFCAGNVLNITGRALYHLMPNVGRPTNPSQLEMVSAFVTGNIPLICWSVFLGCVIAPFTEELLFRGLLFGWLRYKAGAVPALLVSSVVFAMFHFDPNGFVQYFALGFVLAVVYNRTRNLWLSMMIHGLWNLWVVATVFWVTSYHK